MSAYSSLHLSNTPIIGYFPSNTNQEYHSKNLIHLFWLSLFSEDNIHLCQSTDEDEYSFYFLQTERINAIYNFQKYFGIWIHFNKEAFQLASLFLDFLKSREEQYLTLRFDDLYAMGSEPDDTFVHDDIVEMLDFFPKFHKNPNLKKIKANNYLGLSINSYLKNHLRNGLDGEMFMLDQNNSQVEDPKQNNSFKSLLSKIFKKY